MWIFHPKIAEHRVKYNFIVKIENHTVATLVGRNGKIIKSANPRKTPLEKNVSASVEVEYTDNKSDRQVEDMEVKNLRPTRIKKKGEHVVISGEYIGELVRHIKTEGSKAKVKIGGEKKGIDIDIKLLCPVE